MRHRYVDIAVHLLQSGRHSKWKAELHEKKTTHLAFDTVNPYSQPARDYEAIPHAALLRLLLIRGSVVVG